MIEGTAYEKRNRGGAYQMTENRKRLMNKVEFLMFSLNFMKCILTGVRSEVRKEQDLTRYIISSDVENFHNNFMNCAFSDGSVGRGARRENGTWLP